MTELVEFRQYLRGCPKDRRSINRHAIRTYEHDGARFTLDRTLDADPRYFTLDRWTGGMLAGKTVPIGGKKYWGYGWSWNKAVNAILLALAAEADGAKQCTPRGAVEGWYVELNDDQHKARRRRCITCGHLTYGRNTYGEPQDLTCYFDALVEADEAVTR